MSERYNNFETDLLYRFVNEFWDRIFSRLINQNAISVKKNQDISHDQLSKLFIDNTCLGRLIKFDIKYESGLFVKRESTFSAFMQRLSDVVTTNNKKILLITGPSGSGKTYLAIELYKKIKNIKNNKPLQNLNPNNREWIFVYNDSYMDVLYRLNPNDRKWIFVEEENQYKQLLDSLISPSVPDSEKHSSDYIIILDNFQSYYNCYDNDDENSGRFSALYEKCFLVIIITDKIYENKIKKFIEPNEYDPKIFEIKKLNFSEKVNHIVHLCEQYCEIIGNIKQKISYRDLSKSHQALIANIKDLILNQDIKSALQNYIDQNLDDKDIGYLEELLENFKKLKEKLEKHDNDNLILNILNKINTVRELKSFTESLFLGNWEKLEINKEEIIGIDIFIYDFLLEEIIIKNLIEDNKSLKNRTTADIREFIIHIANDLYKKNTLNRNNDNTIEYIIKSLKEKEILIGDKNSEPIKFSNPSFWAYLIALSLFKEIKRLKKDKEEKNKIRVIIGDYINNDSFNWEILYFLIETFVLKKEENKLDLILKTISNIIIEKISQNSSTSRYVRAEYINNFIYINRFRIINNPEDWFKKYYPKTKDNEQEYRNETNYIKQILEILLNQNIPLKESEKIIKYINNFIKAHTTPWVFTLEWGIIKILKKLYKRGLLNANNEILKNILEHFRKRSDFFEKTDIRRRVIELISLFPVKVIIRKYFDFLQIENDDEPYILLPIAQCLIRIKFSLSAEDTQQYNKSDIHNLILRKLNVNSNNYSSISLDDTIDNIINTNGWIWKKFNNGMNNKKKKKRTQQYLKIDDPQKCYEFLKDCISLAEEIRNINSSLNKEEEQQYKNDNYDKIIKKINEYLERSRNNDLFGLLYGIFAVRELYFILKKLEYNNKRKLDIFDKIIEILNGDYSINLKRPLSRDFFMEYLIEEYSNILDYLNKQNVDYGIIAKCLEVQSKINELLVKEEDQLNPTPDNKKNILNEINEKISSLLKVNSNNNINIKNIINIKNKIEKIFYCLGTSEDPYICLAFSESIDKILPYNPYLINKIEKEVIRIYKVKYMLINKVLELRRNINVFSFDIVENTNKTDDYTDQYNFFINKINNLINEVDTIIDIYKELTLKYEKDKEINNVILKKYKQLREGRFSKN